MEMVWVRMISPDEDQAKTTKDDRLRSEEVQINVYEFRVSQIRKTFTES